jgi:MFS family permease
MIGIFSIYVPPYCMPTFAESIGLSSGTGAGLVAGFNAASAVGRIGCGFISDKFGPINVLCTCLALLGTSMFIIRPFASTLGVVILFVLISGFMVGGIVSMFPTVVGHLFGSANMSVTMGMILTSWSFGYTLVSLEITLRREFTLTVLSQGSPVAGYILKASGGADHGIGPYRPAIYFAGSLALISTTMVAFVRLLRQRELLAKT